MSASPAEMRRELKSIVSAGLVHDARDEWIRDQALAKAKREIEQEHRDRGEAA